MSFWDTIENIDHQLLLTINGAHTDFLDQFMFYMSEKWVMIPFYLLVLYFIQKNYGWKTTGIFLVSAAIMVVACDLTATYLFKNTILRYRPSHNGELMHQLHYVNNYRGGTYGFYSSHAANMMALAVFTGYFLYGKVKQYFTFAFFLVFLVSISRIYLGVHFPTDIAAGIIAGTIFAAIFIYLYQVVFSPIKRVKI